MLEVRRELVAHLVGAHADLDVDAGGTQPADALTAHPRVGVLDPHDHPPHPGGQDRIDAGWRAARVRTRLEGDVERGATRLLPRCLEGYSFGVRAAGRPGGPLERSGLEKGADPGVRRRGAA